MSIPITIFPGNSSTSLPCHLGPRARSLHHSPSERVVRSSFEIELQTRRQQKKRKFSHHVFSTAAAAETLRTLFSFIFFLFQFIPLSLPERLSPRRQYNTSRYYFQRFFLLRPPPPPPPPKTFIATNHITHGQIERVPCSLPELVVAAAV